MFGMFEFIGVLFFVMFFLVFGIFLFSMIKGISQWNKNNHSPKLTVPARVVAKRTNISRHHHAGDMHHTTTSTTYFATFEVSSGDRMELSVAGHQYGLLIEGDYGDLTFQGTRFLSFERKAAPYDLQ